MFTCCVDVVPIDMGNEFRSFASLGKQAVLTLLWRIRSAHVQTQYGESFVDVGPKLWNVLPLEISG